MTINRAIILISSTLLMQYSCSSCETYASQLKDFHCVSEEPFYEDSGTQYFKVNFKSSDYVMRVRDDDDSSKKELKEYEKVSHVGRMVMSYFTAEDKQNGKVIDVIDDCVDTLTLESTLLRHPGFFGENEKTRLAFFVKLLQVVMDVQDEDLLLSNLRVDNVFISSDHAPMVTDLSNLKTNGSVDSVADKIDEYTSLETYIDISKKQKHRFTGWEDYFAVGVMLYHSVYRHFPFDPTSINSIGQYRNIEVRYESGVSPMTRELMIALMGKFSGYYQIEDIRRFVTNFDQIKESYFNIPMDMVSNIGMNSYMAGNLSSNFVDGDIEKFPSMREDIEANARRIDGVLQESVMTLPSNEIGNESLVQTNIQQNETTPNKATKQMLPDNNGIKKLSSTILPPNLLQSETKQVSRFAALLSVIMIPLFCL